MASVVQPTSLRQGASVDASLVAINEDDPTGGLIGYNLKRLRSLRGWNQERLAEAAGLTPNLISMMENGKRVGRVATLAAVAKALGEPMRELFQSSDTAARPALLAFLESPVAKDVTDEEVLLLRHLSVPSRTMTAESYYLALQMIRSTEPTEPG